MVLLKAVAGITIYTIDMHSPFRKPHHPCVTSVHPGKTVRERCRLWFQPSNEFLNFTREQSVIFIQTCVISVSLPSGLPGELSSAMQGAGGLLSWPAPLGPRSARTGLRVGSSLLSALSGRDSALLPARVCGGIHRPSNGSFLVSKASCLAAASLGLPFWAVFSRLTCLSVNSSLFYSA